MKTNYLAKSFILATIMVFTAFSVINAQSFTVDAPASIAGQYTVGTPLFGPQFSGFSGTVVPATDVDGLTTACVGLDNGVADVTGAVALVDRGACAFTAKAAAAQDAGAIAVIVCNNDTDNPDAVINLGGTDGCVTTIPAVMLSFNACQAIRMETGVTVTYTAPGLPDPGTNFTTAIDIADGTHTVDSLYGGGGIFANSVSAAWYTYTPSADGLLVISSCGQGVDTRAILGVSPGGCVGDVQIVAFNDDAGDACADDPYSSVMEALVFAGQEYLIIWDDPWSTEGFDFTVELQTLPTVNLTFTVNVEDEPITVTGANLSYSFNENNTALQNVDAIDNGDDTWSATIQATTLDTIYYSWAITDGTGPLMGELVPTECSIVDDNGVRRRTGVITAITDAEFAPVCYALCTNCPSVNVTYTVDMTNESVSADGVNLFIGTSIGTAVAYPMTDNADGTWSATVGQTTGDVVNYIFVNGSVVNPANFETVPVECGEDVGVGFLVRSGLIEGFEDYSVETVCFNFCSSCPLDEPTCDEPTVIISEDFEGQTVGEAPTSDFITPWPGTTALGIVSDEVGGTNSHRITGNGSDVDPVYLLADENITSGHYLISWNMLVPEDNIGYYNFQKDVTPGTEWAFQLYFDGDGSGRLEAGSASAAEPRATFTYPVGEFFPIVHVIDVDNNIARVHVNGHWVSSWPLTYQPFATTGLQSFGGVNFYPSNSTNLWYVDDFLFAELPAPGDGLYCQSATSVSPGVITVDELDCFGAGVYYDVDDGSGLQSRWYSYTATEDGYIGIASCGAPADTRGYILGGTCDDLALLGGSDDRCLMSTDDPYASLAEAPVTAGNTYYIVWDDYWEATGFDFELTFTGGDLPEGNFCASAQAVTPGIYTSDSFGEASVGAGLVGASSNPTSAVFAPQLYAGSDWYSYTPTEDQLINISSCASGEDTHLYVYTGTCDNQGTLVLVAQGVDDCGTSSEVLELAVTAGTTYHIEWMDLDSEAAFEWELSVNAPKVAVTFQVDATILVADGELAADGIHIAGAFNDFNGQPMTEGADNVWSITLELDPDASYTYKFQNGLGGWENVDTSIGDDCTVGGYADREVVTMAVDMTLDVVCFGYCVTCVMVDVDEVTLEAGVEVFPNPAKEVLNVQIDLVEAAENLSIRLVNTFGQVVSEQYLGQLQSDMIELDLSKVPAGAYMLQVRDGQSQYTQSVIVQK